MPLMTLKRYKAQKRWSAWVEWTSVAVFALAVATVFFLAGCGDSTVIPTANTEEMAKRLANPNIAIVGNFGQPFFDEAWPKFEQLQVLYPQCNGQWIHYESGQVEAKWRDDQRFYERLAARGGWDPTLNYPGFVFWDNKKVVFWSPVAPMEVLVGSIENW